MKKWRMILLAAATVLTLAACANEPQNHTQSEAEDSGTAQSETEDSSAASSETEGVSADSSEGDAIFAATEGTWRLDGEEGTASIYMDGEGGFITYYASGFVEAAGYLKYVGEDGDGSGRYDLYDGELGYLNSFYFASDTELRFGEEGDTFYIKE